MNGRTNKILALVLLGLVASVLPVHAQPDTLPALNHIALDESGRVAVFYPDGWTFEPGFSLTQDIEANPIQIQVEIIETESQALEDLPDWLLAEQAIPDEAEITPINYGGLDGWIAQGSDFLEEDIFSAVVVLQLTPQELVLFRSDSALATVGDDAALITAMLEKMVILSGVLVTQDETLHFNLPLDWHYTENSTSALAATTEADLIRLRDGQTPDEPGISMQVVTGAVTIPQRVPQETLDFLVNGIPARLQLQVNNTAGEVYLVREISEGQFMVLHGQATTPQTLVDALPVVQAIFASMNVD